MTSYNNDGSVYYSTTSNGDREDIYDGRNQYCGYSNQDGTFDRSGNRVGGPGQYGKVV